MTGNLSRCKRCGKSMIAEESAGHSCTPLIRATRRIKVDKWCVITTRQGGTEVVAVGLDGTLYTLEVSNPSDESKQEDYSEWLSRHPKRDGSTYHPEGGTESAVPTANLKEVLKVPNAVPSPESLRSSNSWDGHTCRGRLTW